MIVNVCQRGWLRLLPFLFLNILAIQSGWASSWNAPHFSGDTKALCAEASGVIAPEGADIVVLDHERSLQFDSDGNATDHDYLVYKVLSQRGVEGWSDVGVSWEPWRQGRPTLRARVIRSDGTVYEMDPNTVTDTPASQESEHVYSDRRVLRAPLPAISTGVVVEEEIDVSSRPLFSGSGAAARFYVATSEKVHHAQLTVEAPTTLPIQYKTQLLPKLEPKMSVSGDIQRLVFEIEDTEPTPDLDSHLPSDVPNYPLIDVSTAQNWRDIADHYASIVDGQIAKSDLYPLVNRLIAGNLSQAEKIAAIVHYLNTEVRYTGVEFGEAAIVPRVPTETLASKYGDCKDKATLLVAMLRAAGIPAYVALLNTASRQDIFADLVAANYFDHAIVYVPSSADGAAALWIDATVQYARAGVLPSADQGRNALVAKADANSLIRTPESRAQDNVMAEERRVELPEYGPAQIVEVTKPTGAFEAWYRDFYADAKNKDNLKNLTSYVQKQYLAESLDKMDRSEPSDLTRPFELRLEIKNAERGYTDLDSAVAAIRLESLFSQLPEDLQKISNPNTKEAGGTAAKQRTADYQLRLPFVAEWHYRIVPPAGFEPSGVPKDLTVAIGPAVLTEKFETDQTGVVNATFRFDTVKRQFSPAEVAEIQTKVADIKNSAAIMVRFKTSGQVLRDAGKPREAFQSYRDVIAQNPHDAVPHLRLAKALLAVGLGDAARSEARLAVQLDAKSALAQATLAEVLEYDLVGRKWQVGSDEVGSAAAWRAAEKLDPKNKRYPANLAVVLEHDRDGIRYSTGSDLRAALAEYHKLTAADLAELGVADGPAFDYFYGGQFAEAQKAIEGIPKPPLALVVATDAALLGAQSAISKAHQQSGDESRTKTVLITAGDMLNRVRLYPLSAELLEAGASGDTATQNLNRAALLRKLRKHEEIKLDGGVRSLIVELFTKQALSLGKFDWAASKLGSRKFMLAAEDAQAAVTIADQDSAQQLRWAALKAGVVPDVIVDVFAHSLQQSPDGNDETGYREALQIPGAPTVNYFVVKEEGHYRLLASSDDLTPLGLEALDRMQNNDLVGAKVLLDWSRDEIRLGGGDDPIAGSAFPRLWNKGQDADSRRMTMAAASLLVNHKNTASRGVELLEQALATAANDIERTNIDIALLKGYQNLSSYEKLLDTANRLAVMYPESQRAFYAQANALREVNQLGEATQLADRRLSRIPNDEGASEVLARLLIQQGDFQGAYSTIHKLSDGGTAGPHDLNQLAWWSLFYDRAEGPDLQSAIAAIQLSNGNASYLQTLASVYAESGKIKEAHDTLLQAMDLWNLDQPDENCWYVLGRIAEQTGDRELAAKMYGYILKPAIFAELGDSTYALAQRRLKILQQG